jgi:hypothetical protein
MKHHDPTCSRACSPFSARDPDEHRPATGTMNNHYLYYTSIPAQGVQSLPADDLRCMKLQGETRIEPTTETSPFSFTPDAAVAYFLDAVS